MKNEVTDIAIQESFTSCCEGYKPVGPELEKIYSAIDHLENSVSKTLIQDCRGLEQGLKDKCAEIKRQKMMMRKLIAPKVTMNAETQCGIEMKNKSTEVIKTNSNAGT